MEGAAEAHDAARSAAAETAKQATAEAAKQAEAGDARARQEHDLAREHVGAAQFTTLLNGFGNNFC